MNNSKRNNKGQFLKGYHANPKTEFKKGHTPFNKGIRQSKWMNPDSIKHTAKTRFKKGNLPQTAKPLGYVSCCEHKTNGRIRGYDWYINIDWCGNRYHNYNYRKYLWETFYGEEAPKEMIFIAKDGNQKRKPTIENIEMISRAENMYRNNPRYNKRKQY